MTPNKSLERPVRLCGIAAGAERQSAPAALITPRRAAAQLHR
jgi:hypothetical protein